VVAIGHLMRYLGLVNTCYIVYETH
jgi:hypothetical protein